jgi:hypothetical protein
MASKASWLNVRDYDSFCKKWNHQSALSSTTSPSCTLQKESPPTDLVFWFQNMNELTFENAFPCSVEEFNTIVNKANGSTKVGVYMLAQGDEHTFRKMLEKLDMSTLI